MFRVLVAGAIAAVACACSKPAADPLELEGRTLFVNNQTSADWKDVEIWISLQYPDVVPVIPAGVRFQTPLDVFVSGWGKRFDFARAQITDVRLSARRPTAARWSSR